jgi:hypothetical protein
VIRIDVLPDDVLLEMFDFYMVPSIFGSVRRMGTEAWQTLVHVCRRWRYVVLGSPRRLNLRLLCTRFTPTRDKLDVWPALPLIITDTRLSPSSSSGMDNIIAALGQSNRVCQVNLVTYARWQTEEYLAAMRDPFPELTQMRLTSFGQTLPVIPDSFLGGSAPRLQIFHSKGIPFPGLPKLFLSTNNLVDLCVGDISHSGYTSPEVMVASISVLSSLKTLLLGFRSPEPPFVSESRSLPPAKRSILPALKRFTFRGVSEYLDEFVTRIDTPQLYNLDVTLFNQIGTPRLAQFINRTPLRADHEARVDFFDEKTIVKLSLDSYFCITIFGPEPDRQLSSVAQVCNPLHTLSTVERLYIVCQYLPLISMGDANENILWLQLLLPFTAVKDLHLYKESAPSIAAALQGLVGRRIIEVLPSLQNIIVEGLVRSEPWQENFGQFVAARQLSGHPIAISVQDPWI